MPKLLHQCLNVNRFYIVYFALIILAILLFWRIIIVHSIDTGSDATLREKGIDQSIKTVPIQGYRGSIYDRNSDVLALSIPVKNIIIDPERLVSFLQADFLTNIQTQTIQDFAKLVKKTPNFPNYLFKKVAYSLNIKPSTLSKRITKLGAQVVLNKNIVNNATLTQEVNRLIWDYLRRRIDEIFLKKINAAIYLEIANTLNLSVLELKSALKSSSSRKYLKIISDLNIGHPIYKTTRKMLSKEQRVFYQDGRYSDKYFGGAILEESQSKRYYPQAEVSAALLGLTTQGQGIEGLEKYYNSYLASRNGKKKWLILAIVSLMLILVLLPKQNKVKIYI